jgi:hypothetical protein
MEKEFVDTAPADLMIHYSNREARYILQEAAGVEVESLHVQSAKFALPSTPIQKHLVQQVARLKPPSAD